MYTNLGNLYLAWINSHVPSNTVKQTFAQYVALQREIEENDRMYARWSASDSALSFQAYWKAIKKNDSMTHAERIRACVDAAKAGA